MIQMVFENKVPVKIWTKNIEDEALEQLKNLGQPGAIGKTTYITFWGVYDDRAAFDQVIRDFKTQNPNIDVRYRMFSYDTYEQQLINQSFFDILLAVANQEEPSPSVFDWQIIAQPIIEPTTTSTDEIATSTTP